MRNNFHCSPKAWVFRKSYGDISLTVVLELPKGNLKKDPRSGGVRMLKDEICNLMNDTEIENLLKLKE